MRELEEPIKMIGVSEVAKACGVSERAVYKWLKKGSLPMTEFFGKTEYSKQIEQISNGKCRANDLLDISRNKLLEI